MAKKSLDDLVRESSLSFTGTVTHVGAATMTDVPVDARTVVMQIDSVLHAPPVLRNLVGSVVTVQLAPRSRVPQPGDTMCLFTEPTVFGDTLAVREVGRMAPGAVAARAMTAAASGSLALDDVALRILADAAIEHARQAAAIVVGRVSSLEMYGEPAIAEHDPDWWVATIDVHHVVSGKLRRGALKVLYANSQDVRWREHPKPRASQEAAFILHDVDRSVSRTVRYQLADPNDVKPVEFVDTLGGGA